MPFEPTALLAVMAHPDDEFAIFPWLAKASREGRAVHCVWLTNGAYGGQSIQRRNEESKRALSRVGIRSAHLTFLGEVHGVPDGQLLEHLGRVAQALGNIVRSIDSPLEILLPAWEGGHQDHDASHLAAIAAANGTPARLYQYSLYHGAGLRGPFFKVMSPLGQNGPTTPLPTSFAERARCVAACLSYRSQWKTFVGLLPFYVLRLLRRDGFVLQAVNPARTAERPHAGPLLYERRTAVSWTGFADLTRAFRHA